MVATARVVSERATGRKMRRPSHTFYLKQRPFVIQPFMIAPVLAGESLKAMTMKSRVVSDPIKNPLIGWWKEYYWFYVTLSDLDFQESQSDSLPGNETLAGGRIAMLLNDPTYVPDAAGNLESAAVQKYVKTTSQNYMTKAHNWIVRHWFRDEQDADGSFQINSMHIAKIFNQGISDSMVAASAYVRPDVNVDLNANATITASEVDEALRRWQWMRANGLTDASYDDYLHSFGVGGVGDPDPHRPELIRYVRDWQYPSNTVEPTTGVPSSAVSWSFDERADKSRFFREPGFVIGLTVTRPKVYLRGQTSHATGILKKAEHWLPAQLRDDAHTTMETFAAAAEPFSTQAAGYWLDVKDLFIYGDQFVNMTQDNTMNSVALPLSTGNKKYPSQTDVDELFSDSVTPKSNIREDGVCNLTIASHLDDSSATV